METRMGRKKRRNNQDEKSLQNKNITNTKQLDEMEEGFVEPRRRNKGWRKQPEKVWTRIQTLNQFDTLVNKEEGKIKNSKQQLDKGKDRASQSTKKQVEDAFREVQRLLSRS